MRRVYQVPTILAFGLAVLAFLLPLFAEADLSLTSGSSATTTPSVATAITGFQIIGPAASTTPVKLRTTSGTLNLSTVSGVTMSGNNSSTVNLSGTVEKLNVALSTLTYRRSSTGTDTLEVSLVDPAEVFFGDNSHLYKFISGSYTWSAARDAAAALTAYGATGYLATISSAAENTFVYQRITGNGWIGATDLESERTWKWVTGPEAGTIFFLQSGFSGGSAVDGLYNAWYAGEPNDYNNGNPGEDCAHMYSSGGQAGTWNDFPCDSALGYVVEFGAVNHLPTVVASNISIVTADVPAVTSLLPANGATEVSPTTQLVIGFSKNVTAGTGNVLIKKAADDSTVESIDITGDQVSGAGTKSITIDPSVTLEEGATYYVTVPNTALKDSSNNAFDGITNNSTWVFTTADITAPSLSAIAATSTATTSMAITWNTNEAASTKVVYGLTLSYGLSTLESDTAPGATVHTVTLSGLLSCTVYHYAAVSSDGSGNNATSSDRTFMTAGCAADAIPTSATSTSITAASGGTSSLEEDGKSFTVSAPAAATATSSSFVIQIKSVPSSPVLESFGRPQNASQEVGITVFDVKAIINGDTVLDSFDHPITISYHYQDNEVSSLDEGSLWLYHYHDQAWVALDDCAVDTSANRIECTTDNFSYFGLFGSPSAPNTSSAPIVSGTSLEARLRNLLQKGEPAAAFTLMAGHFTELLENQDLLVKVLQAYISQWLARPSAAPELASTEIRDLEKGDIGPEVRRLQRLLNSHGYSVAAAGFGSLDNETEFFGGGTAAALGRFQHDQRIVPAAGYFGSRTREAMKAAGWAELWW